MILVNFIILSILVNFSLFQTLKKMNLFGVEGAFLEATKKIQESFKDIEKSFTRRQKYQMKKRQFTFLDKNQLVEVHSKQGMKDGQMWASIFYEFDFYINYLSGWTSTWTSIVHCLINRGKSLSGNESRLSLQIRQKKSVNRLIDDSLNTDLEHSWPNEATKCPQSDCSFPLHVLTGLRYVLFSW